MAEEKEKKKKHAGHGFRHTNVEHLKDGSHIVHHVHEDGPEHDVKHSAASLDHLHDSIQDHLGSQNTGESAADAGDHGVPQEQAQAAGLPMAGTAAPQAGA
jgi:hypothetical protein